MQKDPGRDFLLSGIEEGFHIIDKGATLESSETKYYLSATKFFGKQTEDQILTEITHGHYVTMDTKPTIISTIGAIPPKDSADIRLIHDCSRPFGKSVSIKKQRFQNLEEAVNLIQPDHFMAKVNLKNAYRSIESHPLNYSATGLAWNFQKQTQT